MCQPVLCAGANQIHPLEITNTNPLVIIHALPAQKDATLTPPGKFSVNVLREVSSHFSHDQTASESVYFDGESVRTELSLRYGFQSFDMRLSIPYIEHRGGNLDAFIEGWHDFFNLPQGGRTKAPQDALRFFYERNGETRLDFSQPVAGIGDVQLMSSWMLQSTTPPNNHKTVLRGAIKMPSGDADLLLGSGGWTASLWLAQEINARWLRRDALWYRSLGAIWLQKAQWLPELQNPFVVFGGIGAGVHVSRRIVLQAQLDAHTPLYSSGEFSEISGFGLQLAMGGNWMLNQLFNIDIAVIEDLNVHASPDVIFHFKLNARFD